MSERSSGLSISRITAGWVVLFCGSAVSEAGNERDSAASFDDDWSLGVFEQPVKHRESRAARIENTMRVDNCDETFATDRSGFECGLLASCSVMRLRPWLSACAGESNHAGF